MSSIVIKGNTSGQIELAAPDVAGSTTLTLPTGTGTVITTDNIDSNPPASLSTATGSAPSYSARAWVNFNGMNTVSIRDSENVTSITDQGTGDYFVNFTTNMQSSGHSYVGCCNEEGGNPHFCNPTQGTSAGFRIRVFIGTTNAAADVSIINFAVFD